MFHKESIHGVANLILLIFYTYFVDKFSTLWQADMEQNWQSVFWKEDQLPPKLEVDQIYHFRGVATHLFGLHTHTKPHISGVRWSSMSTPLNYRRGDNYAENKVFRKKILSCQIQAHGKHQNCVHPIVYTMDFTMYSCLHLTDFLYGRKMLLQRMCDYLKYYCQRWITCMIFR